MQVEVSHTNYVCHYDWGNSERISSQVDCWHGATPVLNKTNYYGHYKFYLKRGHSVLLSPEHFEDTAGIVYSCAFGFISVTVSCSWLSYSISCHFVSDSLIYRSLLWPLEWCVWLSNSCVVRPNMNNSGLALLLHSSTTFMLSMRIF